MKRIARYPRFVITIFIIVACVFFLTKCIDKEKDKAIPAPTQKISFEQFAGSETCAGCHKNIYDTHIHTAHYLTTRPALEKYIKGSFEPGRNRFIYDSGMIVMMEKRDSGFYQVGYYNGIERLARRFDIVVGSASKGQTYIYRVGNRLFQLPVSYFTVDRKSVV